MSSWCVPASITAPRSISTIRSAGCTVVSRWVMKNTVRPRKASSRFRHTWRSVRASNALVASSRISSLGFCSTALARANRCRWPPESPAPRSPTSELYPLGRFMMKS